MINYGSVHSVTIAGSTVFIEPFNFQVDLQPLKAVPCLALTTTAAQSLGRSRVNKVICSAPQLDGTVMFAKMIPAEYNATKSTYRMINC